MISQFQEEAHLEDYDTEQGVSMIIERVVCVQELSRSV